MPAKPSKSRPVDKMNFEQALTEIESVIQRIEQGEVGLDKSLAEYGRGTELLKRCRAILDAAEKQIEELTTTQGDE